MKKYVYYLLIAIALGSYGAYKYQHYLEIEGLTDMTNMDVLAQLEEDFKVCPIEEKPPLSEETQVLYNYAYYHDLHNMWNGQKGDAVWQSTLPYYRIAAANGDYKANVRLQYLLRTKRIAVDYPWDEIEKLGNRLEQQMPAITYYQKYFYIKNQQGWKINKHEELVFLRKAAELGSREAQYELADVIIQLDDDYTHKRRRNIQIQLLECASQQGLGEASRKLGYAKSGKYNDQTVKAFHQGVKNGDAQSAFILGEAFGKKDPSVKEEKYLGLNTDLERSIRYKMIKKYLSHKYYLNPKVPDLDEIVPLPPAPLSAWDGKIAFQRWYEGTPPAKPSDELMQKLAEHAGLDVNTGLPLKKSK